VLPGDYTFSLTVPVLGSQVVSIKEGDAADVALGQTDKRATLHIVAPNRDFPNPSLQCLSAQRNFLVQRSIATPAFAEPQPYDLAHNTTYYSSQTYYGITRFKALSGASQDVHVFPFTDTEAPNHYEYVVNNQVQQLTVKPGDTVTVNVKRIDVDDVEVTKEDGTTYMAHGTYQVFRQSATAGQWTPVGLPGGQYSDCSTGQADRYTTFPTKTGIDVLPGTYKVVISYTTQEGPDTEEDILNLN
jgi:hypothetical protein